MKKWPIHTIAKEMYIYVDAWNLVFNVLLFPFYCICHIYTMHITLILFSSLYELENPIRKDMFKVLYLQ